MSYIGQTLPADTFQGFTTDSFAGDGSATTFTLSKTPFNESALLVVINNVIQKPTTNFTVSGTTLTIVGTAVASGDVIYATHIGGALPIGQAASLDLNGASDQLILDADADTTISADTDDQIDIKIGGSDIFQMTASKLDLNGKELVLDADADTSITADTDDQIDIRIAGADDFQFTANTFTAQSGSTITTPTLGVANTKDLGVGIHVKIADSGQSAVNSAADELVLENSASCGLSIFSGTSEVGKVAFGDSGDNNRGEIVYNHSTDHMTIYHEGDEAIVMGGGRFHTGGETAGDVSAGGLCLNQGGNDTNIITLKSSDIDHGITSAAETDTYCEISKNSAANGGLDILTYSARTDGEFLRIGLSGNGISGTKSTSGVGAFHMYIGEKSGTGIGGLATNDNMMTIANYINTRFIFDAEGDFHADSSSTTFDAYDDAQLVRAYDLSHGKGVIDSKFDKFVAYNHEKLADLKLVGREEDGSPNNMVSVTGMQRLHNGAIWQQYEKHQRLAEAVYEMAKEALGEDKADAILEKHDIKLLN